MKSKIFQNQILILMVYIRTHLEELLFAEDLYQYDFLSSNIRLNELLSRCMKNLHVLEFFEVYVMILFLKDEFLQNHTQGVLVDEFSHNFAKHIISILRIHFLKTFT